MQKRAERKISPVFLFIEYRETGYSPRQDSLIPNNMRKDALRVFQYSVAFPPRRQMSQKVVLCLSGCQAGHFHARTWRPFAHQHIAYRAKITRLSPPPPPPQARLSRAKPASQPEPCQNIERIGAHLYSREEERTPSDMVMNETFIGFLRPEILQWVRPQQVAHQSMSRRFPEAVDLREQTRGEVCQSWRSCCPKGRKARRGTPTLRKSSSVCSSGERPP